MEEEESPDGSDQEGGAAWPWLRHQEDASDDDAVLAPALWPRSADKATMARCALSSAVAMALLFGATALAVLMLGPSARHTSLWEFNPDVELDIKVQTNMNPGQCGVFEANIDYDPASATPIFLDHIPEPGMCCAMCQGIQNCQAWVWKNAKLPGEPHRCLIMETAAPAKAPAQGVVSGVPPPRAQLAPSSPEVNPAAGTEAFPAYAPGSMFCYALMRQGSGEKELLDTSYSLGTSIFACDKYAVYSNYLTEVGQGSGVQTHIVNSNLQCEVHEIAWNTWIFIAVWKVVLEDGMWRYHDWTIKVDADSVFLPDRLRAVLQNHVGEPYLNNCRYGLHGPIEVLSRAALEVFNQDYQASPAKDRPNRCMNAFPQAVAGTAQWGEDMFIDRCFRKVYGLTPGYDPNLMCESHCDCPDWYWCRNGTSRVSYHPFKRADMFTQCLANAQAQ
jgi:hypothetical protein